jgi:serine-aspartate repeat-containing protein C/D/E
VAVFIDGHWLIDLDGDGVWEDGDLWAKLGTQGDLPVVGDWDGDGKADIGIFGPMWLGDSRAAAMEPGLPDAENTVSGRMKNMPPDPIDAAIGYRTLKRTAQGQLRADLIDHVFQFGEAGDLPVVGDWNGDGVKTIGIFRDGTWFLDMDGDGRWSPNDLAVQFGQAGDIPIVGDWTGDGISKLGVYRQGTFILDTNNNHQIDATDAVFKLGEANDRPAVADFDGDGIDDVAVYQSGPTAETVSQQ